ncbi:MAG: hypothetical protein MJ245_07660 [Clostridia bacterium]|nr:hypothetical protein [Clostridia bacterium]
MYIPFNETSVHNDFLINISFEKCNEIILTFISLIKEARTNHIIDGIVVNSSTIIECIPFIQSWLNDPRIDRSNKMLLRSSLHSFFTLVEEPLTDANIVINKIKYNSKGAGLAVDTKCNYLLNLLTHKEWEKESNFYNYETIDENEEYISSIIELNQVYSIDSLTPIVHQNRKDSFSKISSGQDLWERWEEFFPNLIKCEITKDCLYKNPEKNHILKIIEQLDLLQTYFVNLKTSFSFDELKLIGVDASDESDTVKRDPNLNKYRLFKLPNETKDFFFYHTKFFGKFETRLYFLPIKNSNKCYIGYIGKHLKTQKF